MIDEKVIAPEWLKEKTKQIRGHVSAADDELLKAARLLVEIKSNFDEGVFTKLTWRNWLKDELAIGERRVRELLRIGRAEDPAAELAEQRATNTVRQQRYRAAQTETRKAAPRVQAIGIGAEPAPANAAIAISAEANELIAWATNASAEHIKAVLGFIANLDSARATA